MYFVMNCTIYEYDTFLKCNSRNLFKQPLLKTAKQLVYYYDCIRF